MLRDTWTDSSPAPWLEHMLQVFWMQPRQYGQLNAGTQGIKYSAAALVLFWGDRLRDVVFFLPDNVTSLIAG